MTVPLPDHLLVDSYLTPIGSMLLATDDAAILRGLDLTGDEQRFTKFLHWQYGDSLRLTRGKAPAKVRVLLDEYFAGRLEALDDIECQADGTEFQRGVWTALRDIPAGQTISYGTLAKRLGNPKAVRAVGLANGQNPIPIVIPCHRGIGSDGSLTGDAGGIGREQLLLDPARQE